MKLLFLLMLIVQGLIHISGLVGLFERTSIIKKTENKSRTTRKIHFITGFLFILVAILLFLEFKFWWVIGMFAVTLSQILIFKKSKFSKSGTLINLIVLSVCCISFTTWNFHHQYENEVKANLKQSDYFNSDLLSEKDLNLLPEPVNKYLHYAGVVGKPKVNNFKITFRGKIRKNEQSEWMPFTSEQFNFMQTPTRLFFMNAEMKNMPVAGYHSYFNGNASMDIRLFSLVKVQYLDGLKMSVAETVTFFNDMCCMAPATLIDKRINWNKISKNAVNATFTNNGITISAELFFNDEGELINFISGDRYNAEAGKVLPWSTPLKHYKNIHGFRLASYAEAIYKYPDRELCYGNFALENIEYNCKSLN